MSKNDTSHKAFHGGFSNSAPLARWVMGLIPPQPIESRRPPLPVSRERWWQTL